MGPYGGGTPISPRNTPCSSGLECSGSGRRQSPDARNRGRRLCLPRKPPGRSRRSGILIAEGDVAMDVVADVVDTVGAGVRLPDPTRGWPDDPSRNSGCRGKNDRLLEQVFHRVLVLRSDDRVGLAGVVHQRARREAQPAGRREHAGAPVAKAIPVGRHGHERLRDDAVWSGEVADARDGCSTSAPSASAADSRRSARSPTRIFMVGRRSLAGIPRGSGARETRAAAARRQRAVVGDLRDDGLGRQQQ